MGVVPKLGEKMKIILSIIVFIAVGWADVSGVEFCTNIKKLIDSDKEFHCVLKDETEIKGVMFKAGTEVRRYFDRTESHPYPFVIYLKEEQKFFDHIFPAGTRISYQKNMLNRPWEVRMQSYRERPKIMGVTFRPCWWVNFYSNGNIASCLLCEENIIQGIAFQGDIQFHDNGKVAMGELAKDTNIEGIDFPANSTIMLDNNGNLVNLHFPKEFNRLIEISRNEYRGSSKTNLWSTFLGGNTLVIQAKLDDNFYQYFLKTDLSTRGFIAGEISFRSSNEIVIAIFVPWGIADEPPDIYKILRFSKKPDERWTAIIDNALTEMFSGTDPDGILKIPEEDKYVYITSTGKISIPNNYWLLAGSNGQIFDTQAVDKYLVRIYNLETKKKTTLGHYFGNFPPGVPKIKGKMLICQGYYGRFSVDRDGKGGSWGCYYKKPWVYGDDLPDVLKEFIRKHPCKFEIPIKDIP